MKRVLLFCLLALLLAAPTWAQNSPQTDTFYIVQTHSFVSKTTDQAVDVEVPSWAEAMIFSYYISLCTGCTGNVDLGLYYPGTSTVVEVTDDDGAYSATGWYCIIWAPVSVDFGCTELQVPIPPGTVNLNLDITAGTVSAVGYVRFIGRAK